MIGRLLCRMGWHNDIVIKAPGTGIAFCVICLRCQRVYVRRIPRPREAT
jgi:hypothetical protein